MSTPENLNPKKTDSGITTLTLPVKPPEGNVRCEDCGKENCEIRGQGNQPMPCKDFVKRKEGWAFLWNSKKVHYFRESRSLCGRWLCFSMEFYPDENLNSPDNCAECRRRRTKELEKMKRQ
jgi:hypothetical protein